MSTRVQIVSWLLLLAFACLVSCSESPTGDHPEGNGTSSRDIPATDQPQDRPTAGTIFAERCAGCHADPENKRAIQVPAMARLSPAHIVFAMTNGSMRVQADGLTIDQMIGIAGLIAGNRIPYQPSPDKICADRSISTKALIGRWGIDDRNSAALSAGISRIDSSSISTLVLAWAFGLPDVANARSQPVITEDTLFVAATSGHLFALDRASGCIKWHRPLEAPPRTALTLGSTAGAATLYFGDMEAHVNAVDALTGELIWRSNARVSEHSMLTGAQIQHAERLIVPVSLYEVSLASDPDYECCISHGAVLALDSDTGDRLWTTPLTEPAQPQAATKAGTPSWGPSGVPVWSTPTVDRIRGRVYVGTGQNASLPSTDYSDSVVALNLETGKVAWHFQAIAGDAYNMACDQRPPGPNCPKWRGPDHDIGAAVVLVENGTGRDRLIVGQKSGDIYALDPDANGTLIWQRKVGAGSALGGVHWGLAVADGVIYAPIADPPFPIPHYRPRPGLYALDVDTGESIWERAIARDCETNFFEYFRRETLYPECSFFYGLSAAPLVVNDLIFAPALDGRLRAFSRDDGRVLWSTDTATEFETINGVEGHGGSIDVAGVQAVGDMLYVQSGYGMFGQLPGNLLLAFELTD